MIHNQDSFLNHLADRLGRPRRREGVFRPAWRHQPQWQVLEGLDRDHLSAVLEEQCARIHTDLVRTDVEGLPEALNRVLEKLEARSVVLWNDPRFAEYGLSPFPEGTEREVHVWNPDSGEENIQAAERADVGITFGDLALAESGTVVLFNDRGKGRSVSLLPQSYIAIIPKSSLIPRMSQATREIHRRVEAGETLPSCINFISGPSNSADIEMNLVVGVHGPVRAVYFLMEDK